MFAALRARDWATAYGSRYLCGCLTVDAWEDVDDEKGRSGSAVKDALEVEGGEAAWGIISKDAWQHGIE